MKQLDVVDFFNFGVFKPGIFLNRIKNILSVLSDTAYHNRQLSVERNNTSDHTH